MGRKESNQTNKNLMITFENSLDPDQDPHFVCPDLDQNCLAL